MQSGLDWEDPAATPKRLSELPAALRVPAPSAGKRAFMAGRVGFEADFAETFVPAGPPPGAERAGSVAAIPVVRWVTGFGRLGRPAATWRRALKGGYLVVLGAAAVVTVVLLGYWGLIGSFTS